MNSRGSDILSYNVEAESESAVFSMSKGLPRDDNMAETFSKNLRDDDLGLMTQVLYNIRVYAENSCGRSAPSNVEEFIFTAETGKINLM